MLGMIVRMQTRAEPTVGILLVHGIGQQRPGAAMVAFLGGLMEAFRSDPVREVTATHTEARVREPGTPSSGRVRITWQEPGESERTLHVHVREAHWADSFYPAKPLAVLKWILLVGPLTLLTRSIESIDVAFRRWHAHPLHWWRIVAALIALVVAPPIAVLLVAAVGSLSLVRPLIPVQWLREAIGRAQIVLSEVLGDSYLYLVSETDASAIRTVVRDGLSDLSACPNILVCAHSQGAQVAVDAIRESENQPAYLFTYGAGIGQLDWLRFLLRERRSAFLIGAGVWIGILATFVGAVALVVGLQQDRFGTVAIFLFITGVYYLVPLLAIRGFRWLGSLRRDRLPISVELVGVRRWVDIAASADPVSGNPVLSGANQAITTRIVVNGNNLATDHTSYLANVPEVMRWVAAEVAVAGGATGLSGSLAPSRLQVDRRHEAGRHRVSVRLLALAVTAYGLALLWSRRREHYESVRGWVHWLWLDLPRDATWSRIPLDALLELILVVAAVLVGLALPFMVCRRMLREAADNATSPRDPGLYRATWWLVSLGTQVGGAALALSILRALDDQLGRDTLRQLWEVMAGTVGSVTGGLLVSVLVARVGNVRDRDDALLVDVAGMFTASSVVILAGAGIGWGALAAVTTAMLLPLMPGIVSAVNRLQARLGTPRFELEDHRADRAWRVVAGGAFICLPIGFLGLMPRMSDTVLDTIGGIVVAAEALVAFGGLAASLVVQRTSLAWLIGLAWVAYWAALAVLTFQRLGASVG